MGVVLVEGPRILTALEAGLVEFGLIYFLK